MGHLKPAEAARRLGVSVKTLQRWDKNGLLVAKRHPSGRRYYEEEDILNMENIEHGIDPRKAKIVESVVLTSGNEQTTIKPGDIVTITTDSTDFDEEYIGEVESVNVDEIVLKTDMNIPWEYIIEIDVVPEDIE